MKKLFIISLFSLLIFNVFCQKKDSISLFQEVDSIVVLHNKKSTQTIQQESIYNIESYKKISFSSLDKILENNSKVNLKNYGEGQLSTVSVKGFNASQTDILWNGVKINSPTLGQADISTISIGNNTRISIYEDNSDNISGSISLRNNINFYKKGELKVASSLSSFGSFKQGLSYEFSKKNKFYSNSNISFAYNLNKYKYINKSLPNTDEIYLSNSETKTFHFEQINAFKLSKNDDLNIFFKVFYADRNIAPTIYETSSSKNQKNNLFLGKIEWLKTSLSKNYSLMVNTSIVHQKLNYKLSKNSTSIINSSNSLQTNFKFSTKIIKKIVFDLHLKNSLENGNSNNYTQAIWQNTVLLKPKLSFKINKDFSMNISVAEMLLNKQFSQLLPSFQVKYFKTNMPANVLLQFDYSRKTRFPSLNDKHWNPGGNINLKPEYAHNFNFVFGLERDFKKQSQSKKLFFKNKLELFNIYAENYIQWQPTKNGYWAPKNIGKVFSRGLTNNFTVGYHFNPTTILKNEFSYNFTRITKEKDQKQLIYVPMSRFFNLSKIETKWLIFYIEQQYISESFTSYNNSLKLNAYYLLDLALSKVFKFKKKQELEIVFETNNILNTTYFTYVNRALPKRTFNLKILFSGL